MVEYYYKAKWGYADEFIRLFKKNHYPFLKKQIEIGNALQVTAQSPINHQHRRWALGLSCHDRVEECASGA